MCLVHSLEKLLNRLRVHPTIVWLTGRHRVDLRPEAALGVAAFLFALSLNLKLALLLPLPLQTALNELLRTDG